MTHRRETGLLMKWGDAAGNGTGEMSAPLKDVRILIVDDDPDTILLFTLTFEQAGAIVLTAMSMDEALTAIAHHQPNVLLSDIQMPGQTGYTLIRTVRSLEMDQRDERQDRLPAIAVTACAGNDTYKEAIAAGFDRYLTKPVDLDRLLAAVVELTTLTAL